MYEVSEAYKVYKVHKVYKVLPTPPHTSNFSWLYRYVCLYKTKALGARGFGFGVPLKGGPGFIFHVPALQQLLF